MLGRSELLVPQRVRTLRRLVAALGGAPPETLKRDELLHDLMGLSTGRLRELVSALQDDELRRVPERFLRSIADAEVRDALSWRLGSLRAPLDADAAALLTAIEACALCVDARNCWVSARISSPATAAVVEAVEQKYAVALPARLVALFREVAGRFTFQWGVDGARLDSPEQVDLGTLTDEELGLFRGRIAWDATGLLELGREHLEIRGEPLMPLFAAGSGDAICGEIRGGALGRIVWWSHDDDAPHGQVLAESFDEWLELWGSIRWLEMSGRAVALCFGEEGADATRRLRSRLEELDVFE